MELSGDIYESLEEIGHDESDLEELAISGDAPAQTDEGLDHSDDSTAAQIPEFDSEAEVAASEGDLNGIAETLSDLDKDSEYKWYVLRTFTGHEQKVKAAIEAEVKRLNLKEKIRDVIIPQETVFEVRNGKRRTKIKNFLPGYIVIRLLMDKKIKDIITNVPSVVSFVGTKTEPSPLQQHEIDRIIGRVEERKSIATIETTFEIGDPVRVIDGPFTNFNGTVRDVNMEKQKLKVEVGILGRKTPVELDFSQVEMENH